MTPDIFISYKREDELRVARLVRALEQAGLSVWWDRALPGGEPWRANIEAALDQARSAVVVWTQASAGPEGGFVRDEAARAARRQVLVPVLLDRGLAPPLGFGELQAIDLSHWRGSARDPFFQDLVAALRARMAGQPAPSPQGPLKRLQRRLAAGGLATALGLLAAGFATNALNLQNQVCTLPLPGPAQPALSDACGALHLGGRPTRDERLAWAQRPPGSCEALRAHVRQFPEGAYRLQAQALVDARTPTRQNQWLPQESLLPLYVKTDGVLPAATEAAARASALERGRQKAADLCQTQGKLGGDRLRDATVTPGDWVCEPQRGGFVCGFEGKAQCMLEVAQTTEGEVCDTGPGATAKN